MLVCGRRKCQHSPYFPPQISIIGNTINGGVYSGSIVYIFQSLFSGIAPEVVITDNHIMHVTSSGGHIIDFNMVSAWRPTIQRNTLTNVQATGSSKALVLYNVYDNGVGARPAFHYNRFENSSVSIESLFEL